MVNDEGTGVLIVTSNDDAVDDSSENAGRAAGTQRLSVLVPSKGDGKAAFQNLAGDGRPHSFIEQLIGEEEGHDGRRGCNRIITESRLVNSRRRLPTAATVPPTPIISRGRAVLRRPSDKWRVGPCPKL